MYTGIIDHLGEIIALQENEQSMRITIKCDFTDIKLGESIAVDGICFTVIEPMAGQFSCDVSPETLNLTTAKNFRVEQRINLERSLAVGDRFGGHMVMGHVDTAATITKIEGFGEYTKFTVTGLDENAMKYIVHKGSVAVNGISLTVNDLVQDGFELMIIPHTLQLTDLQFLKVGDRVNIEFDTLMRAVMARLQQMPLADIMSQEVQE